MKIRDLSTGLKRLSLQGVKACDWRRNAHLAGLIESVSPPVGELRAR